MKTPFLHHGLTLGLALLALPTAALAADGFARSSGILRAGAGSDYPAITRVAAGTDLDVLGCTARRSWCDVAVDGERGWFPGRRIGLLRDGRRVYLSDGGAALGLTVLTFGMADYWGSHYADRPFYNERRWWRGHGSMPPRGASPGQNGRPPQDQVRPLVDHVRAPGHRAEPPVARERPSVVHTPRAVREPTRSEPRRQIERSAPHVRAPEHDAAPRRQDRPQPQPQQQQQRGPADHPASGPLLIPR